MNTHLSVLSFFVAFVVGLAAMPTNVFKVCAWNVGTAELDPWRIRTMSAIRQAGQTIRAWLASLWSPRIALACLAVIIALLAAQHAAHGAVLLAATPLATLKTKKEDLVRAAQALCKDGKFADQAARDAFDAKMAEARGLDEEIRAMEAAGDNKPLTDADLDAARKAGADSERCRIKGIRDAVRIAKLETVTADKMIERGIAIEAARAEIFAELEKNDRKDPTDPHIQAGADAQDKFMRGATNWLLMKGGQATLVRGAVESMKKRGIAVADVEGDIDPGEFRGLTLLDLARMCLERAGRSVRGMNKMDLVAQAFLVRGQITQSTSDFAVLLENTMNKVLQAAYATTPDTWRRFCAESTVTDFRAANRYRMGNFGALDSLNENGEFKNKAIQDAEKATITASTKGNIINVSRQMIVNDDLNAFSRLPMMLGRAAALSIETDVYALLGQNSGLGPTQSDTHPLFYDATRSNVSTGAALSAAAIDADRVKLGSQKDPWGNEYLDLRPAVLLVPLSLGGQARVINNSQYDPDNLASGSKAQQIPNKVVGLFRDVIDTPRLTGTRRYIFADPGIAPVFEVAFLEGQTAPVLESQDGWRVDGAEMKARIDYGVAAVDYRGAVTNAGA